MREGYNKELGIAKMKDVAKMVDSEDFCVHCKHSQKSTLRYTFCVAIACVFVFLITCILSGFVLYFYLQLNDIRRELGTFHLTKFHDVDQGISSGLQSNQLQNQQQLVDSLYNDQVEETIESDKIVGRYTRKAEQPKTDKKSRDKNQRRRHRKDKRDRKDRKDKKECRCKTLSKGQRESVEKIFDERMLSVKEEQQNKESDVQKTEQFSYISAAHYTTYVNNEYIAEVLGEIDQGNLENTKMSISDLNWQGTLYRNRTFVAEVAPLTFKFFKEADWMQSLTTDRLFYYNPTTGKFKVRHNGLYHLYAHVLFYDLKTRMAIGIIHESGNDVTSREDRKDKNSIAFRCMESTDFIVPSGQNSKFKSCNVNGVLYLRKGDNLSVQSLYSNTCIDLTSDATYFGAVLFSPNEL